MHAGNRCNAIPLPGSTGGLGGWGMALVQSPNHTIPQFYPGGFETKCARHKVALERALGCITLPCFERHMLTLHSIMELHDSATLSVAWP